MSEVEPVDLLFSGCLRGPVSGAAIFELSYEVQSLRIVVNQNKAVFLYQRLDSYRL